MLHSNISLQWLDSRHYALFELLRIQALTVASDAFGETIEEFLIKKSHFSLGKPSTDHHGIVGAFEGEKLIGMLGFYVKDNIKEKHKVYLWGLFVLTGYRNQGIGTLLLKWMVDYCVNKSVEQILVPVITPNKKAIYFYKKNGFKRLSSEKKAFLKDNHYFGKMVLWRDLITCP